jgi:hypothetical protein
MNFPIVSQETNGVINRWDILALSIMASIGECIPGLARGVARWTCRKAAIVYAGCMVQFEEKIALQSDHTNA